MYYANKKDENGNATQMIPINESLIGIMKEQGYDIYKQELVLIKDVDKEIETIESGFDEPMRALKKSAKVTIDKYGNEIIDEGELEAVYER